MSNSPRLSIAFATESVPMHGRTPLLQSLGGSESALVFAARGLAARGHHVEVFTRCSEPGVYDDVTYQDIAELDGAARLRDWDVFVSLRFPGLIMKDIRAALRVLWCQDVLDGAPVESWLLWADLLVFVSDWHRERTVRAAPGMSPHCAVVENPVDLNLVPPRMEGDSPLLVHLSRPERGLRALLAAWPSIRARVPEARLAVARYRSYHEPRGGQVEAFCLAMDAAVAEAPGASHLGNLSKPELYELLSRATLMVYPAEFDETSCIAAIESQACGLPVVAVRRGALPETLGAEAAVLVEPGPEMVSRFADRVVELLYDAERRRLMGEAGRTRATDFAVERIAEKWERLFLSRLADRASRQAEAIQRSLVPTASMAECPGISEALWSAIVQRIRGAGLRSFHLLGDPTLGAELSRRSGARHADREETTDGVVDWGTLLETPDRAAFLRDLSARFPSRPILHVLPAASGQPGQRVHPTYGDIVDWFGEEAEIGLTLEAELPWGEPARCWIAGYRGGTIPAGADRPEEKRWRARPRPTLSACLIVRDAADTLLTTLQSLVGVVDEIRVLDTGSRDNTIDLVEGFRKRAGVPVHLWEEPWPNDFSEARNRSVAGAEGDWILWIDADERLIGGERLRRLIQTEHFEALAIRQHNHIFDRGTTQIEIPFRVYRNGRGYRFYGAVHEHPERSLNEPIEPWIVAPEVDILHYGYLTERGRVRKLLARNLALLMRDFELYPGRRLTEVLYLRDCVNLARFDRQAGRPVRADHREALLVAIERFEAVAMGARDRYYHLGREYYDLGLRLLDLGREVVVQISGDQEGNMKAPARHRCRLPIDVDLLAKEAVHGFYASNAQNKMGGVAHEQLRRRQRVDSSGQRIAA